MILNPFTLRPKPKQSGWIKFDKLKSPIPDYIEDPEKVKMFFENSPWIPYAGLNKMSSHSLVKKLQQMKLLSVTKGAVMGSINTYCFGGEIKLVNSIDMDFDLGQESVELSINDRQLYYDHLKGINLFGKTERENALLISDSLQTTGEAMIELIMTNIDGVKSFGYNFIDSQFACLKKDESIVGISQSWTDTYIKKNPVTEIPLYPEAKVMEDGSIRSILLYKKGRAGRGRPDDMSSFTSQYNEARKSEFLAKQINTSFVGRVLIEVGEDGTTHGHDIHNGGNHETSLQRFEKNYTIDGDDPTGAFIFSRPKGVEKTEVTQIKPNTDAKYIKEVSEQLRSDIISANDWSEAILLKDHSGGLSQHGLRDIFTILNLTKVTSHRKEVTRILSKAYKIGAEFLENDLALSSSMAFTGPADQLIESLSNEINNSAGNN